MTEREKREKAIEEMAEMVEVFTRGVCSTRQGVIDALERGGYSDIKNLYEAGYRKEEEVRKETIIKVAKWLNGRVNTDVIWFLLRAFGVEVEE